MNPAARSHAAASVSEPPLDNTVAIETPEHIHFRHFVAGPTRRFLAYLIDLGVRLVMGGIVGFGIVLAAGGSPATEGLGQGLVLLVLFALEWVYYVLFESFDQGRTPGKRALRLRVVKEGGEPITFIDSVLRNLLRAADFLPMGYALGALTMVADGRFRRLGDRVAGTMVVVDQSANVEAPPALVPPAHPDELALLPARVPLSADELLALDMFVRRGALSDARRVELADMVAPLWARRAAVQAPDPVRFLSLLRLRAWGHRAGDEASERKARSP